MLIEIDKIVVNDRIRKDFGNIEELANDIKENGLINPPVITPDTYELIAGERRLRAMKSLGYKQIEVRPMSIKNAEHALNLEISENETRKDFSKAERIDYARRLERIESLKAKERMDAGVTPSESFLKGRTTDIVAEKLNIGSGKQYEKEKYIVENQSSLTSEDFDNWDEGKLSTNKAFLKIKQEKEQLQNQLRQERNKPPTVIDNTDYYAIDKLKNQLTKKDKDMEFIKREKEILEKKVKLNEEDAKKYKNLKEQIEYLQSEKEDIARQIESATSISGLIVEVENVLRTKLAPIKYSRAIQEQLKNPTVIKNVYEIVDRVECWCNEMKKVIGQDYIIINEE